MPMLERMIGFTFWVEQSASEPQITPIKTGNVEPFGSVWIANAGPPESPWNQSNLIKF